MDYQKSRILLQHKEIEDVAKEHSIRIFKGIESDILKDGSLDYDEDFLSGFEFVVASVHSRFKLDKKEMTRRMLKAIENEHTDVLGHASGRLLLSRDPFEFDVDKILDACSRNQVAVEINANPRRLDIDWRYLFSAREKGCLFSINADAHSIAEIDLTRYGIMMGRKGGLQKTEVINYFDETDFIKFLNRKRKRI
jgi:DNA polymerase (family X)